MAKRIQQILDVKERAIENDRLFYLQRLSELRFEASRHLHDNTLPDQELMKYLPIAIVACFEAYFRASVAEIIDEGEPYINRASQLNNQKINLKFDIETLSALHKKSLTIGDIVAYSLSYNNIEEIDKYITILLNKNFLEAVEQYFDMNRQVYADYDWKSIIQSVHRTYSVRHILCHEFTETSQYDAHSFFDMIVIAHEFLNIVHDFIFSTLYPNHSKMMDESEALQRLLVLEQQLESLVETIIRLMDDNSDIHSKTILTFQNSDLFRQAIAKWKDYRDCRGLALGTFSDTLFFNIYNLLKKEQLTSQMIDSLQREFEYVLKKAKFEFYKL